MQAVGGKLMAQSDWELSTLKKWTFGRKIKGRIFSQTLYLHVLCTVKTWTFKEGTAHRKQKA